MRRGRCAWLGAAVVALAVLGSQSSLAAADHDRDRSRNRSLKASLTGFEEPPAVLTTGRGELDVKISRDEESFEYELSYQDLEGTVTQSHIHVGQLSVNGGIAVWLCQTATNAAPVPNADGPVPVCPPGPAGGTVTGRVTAAQVIGPAGQGVAPAEFEELLRAMRRGVTYANVHSTPRNPGGEIRGQIQVRHHSWWDDDDN
jgi:hypothetical protein